MNEEEKLEFCKKLMASSPVCYITTIDPEGFPISRAVFNLKNPSKFPTIQSAVSKAEDPFFILIGTNTSSKKVEEIKANPKASIYYCVSDEFRGLSLSGILKIREELTLKQTLWVDGWERYYPQGITDPDFCVLQFKPTYARGWYGGGKYAFGIAYSETGIEYHF